MIDIVSLMTSGDTGCPGILSNVDTYLRQMVNDSELSDVTFVCQDGIHVHGCRILLAERCSFFKGLLFGSVVEFEGKKTIVHLPTVSSPVLILVMKFLYTNKLLPEDLYPPSNSTPRVDGGGRCFSLDWEFLLKVISTARLLVLDGLERLVIEKLRSDVPHGRGLTEDVLVRVARGFSLLSEYASIWTESSKGEGKSIKEIHSSMVDILATHDLSVATLSHLSEAVFRSYLAETQGRRYYTRGLLLDEYSRLREVLTWCATTGGVDTSLNSLCLPSPEVAMDYIEWSRENASRSDFKRAEFNFSRDRRDFLQRIKKESLKVVLPFTNFTLIHPELLSSVVEPILSHIIEIMEPKELAKILCDQAHKAVKQLRDNTVSIEAKLPNPWHVVGDADVMEVMPEDEYSFSFTTRREVATPFTVSAVAGLQISGSFPRTWHQAYKHQWEIIVTPRGSWEQRSMANFEIGFIFRHPGESFRQGLTKSLSLDSRSSGIRIGNDLKTAQVYVRGGQMHQWKLRQDNQFQWTIPLRVSLESWAISNFVTCKLYYEGDMTILMTFNMDEKLIVYPAVYFKNRGPFKPHDDQLTVKVKYLEGQDYEAASGSERERSPFDHVFPNFLNFAGPYFPVH